MEKVIKKSALAPTVLIAGGAGFIGSHLSEALLLKEARVIVLDNFTTGKDVHINSLLNNPKFAVFDVDINKSLPEEIESVDYIIHLAGFETYLYSKNDINLDSLLTNAVGTRNLLELAHKSPAKFLLASSIDVYQGLISPLNLNHYFGQTEEEERKYSLTEAKRFAEALVWEYFKKHQTDVRIVRLPEIYGPRMNFEASGVLGRHIKDLTENNNLTIYGEGTEKEYYLYVSDAITGITKALFNQNTEGRIYTLTGKEPYAVLETTYLVKGLANRETQVLFKPKVKKGPDLASVIPDQTNLKDLNWEPKVDLREGVVKTLKWLGYTPYNKSFKPGKLIEDKKKEISDTHKDSVESIVQKLFPANHTVVSTKKPPHESPPLSGRNMKKISMLAMAFLTSFLLIFTVVPALQTLYHLKKSASELEKVPALITKLDSKGAEETATRAFQATARAQNAFGKLRWLFNLAGENDRYMSGQKLISSLGYFSKTAYRISKASMPLQTIWEVLRPDLSQKLDGEKLEETKIQFAAAQNQIQLAQAEFKHVRKDLLPKPLRNATLAYESALKESEEFIALGKNLSLELPTILGTGEKKRYLILLQNSNELRPTGGFIGSYAIIELKDGKISNLIIDDIYNPDGQLDIRKISVLSPTPVATFLKEQNLHIRNANWDPSFPKSARQIEDLFYRIDGAKFDGIAAVDLYLAQSLLKISGPIFLTAYNEEITADNVYEKAQFHSEFNYTEGSEQKRSFLMLLGSKLLEKVFALQKDDMPKLASLVKEALDQKHLSIYIPNTVFGTYLSQRGWAGELIKTDGDYLYVVNANMGGNKANYYVKQEMNYTVSAKTRDGVLRGELTLLYNHTGKNNSWPGGPYTNYVRVLTPGDTKITGAKIIYADGTQVDIFEKVVITKESGLNSFETSFALEPNKIVKLLIAYDLSANSTITASNKKYQLYWQKQPGTQNDKITFSFSSPFGTKIAESSPQTQFTQNVYKYEGALNTDLQVNVMLE